MPKRTAEQQVGPHIRFNNRLWVLPWGQETPREGSWTRVNLADRNGNPLKTEVEIHWGKPGELSVYESGRREPTYKYEDAGLFVPPVTEKEVAALGRGQGEAASLAKRVAEALKDKGYGAAEARGYAADLAEDVNFHSLARVLGGNGPDVSPRYPEVARALGYGVYEAAFFGMFLAKAFGDSGTVRLITEHLIGEMTNERRSEAAGRFHMRAGSLRSEAIRVASTLPEGSPGRRALLTALAADKTARLPPMDQVTDYLLNAIEHTSSESEAVSEMAAFGVPRTFAKDLIQTWWKIPPRRRSDLYGAIAVVAEVAARHGIELD